MKLPKRGEKGFTLVELLIVLAILAVLAAVVIPNVTGMFGRGAAQAWDTDNETLQMASATFYFDTHEYADSTTTSQNGWNEADGVSGHWYPTDSGDEADLILDETVHDADNPDNYLVVVGATGNAAVASNILAGAIWMNLLSESPAAGTAGADEPPGDGDATLNDNCPLPGEKGPYLNEVPESCNDLNADDGSGSYTWIIGKDGKVYGVYVLNGTDIVPAGTDGTDYYLAGFSGDYP